MDLTSTVTVELSATPNGVTVRVVDARSDSITLFTELTEDQGHQLATDAWTVGLRAISNAYAQAQEARLQDVGKSLLADIDQQLRGHVESQHQTIASVLGKFFDPQDGQVAQRLAAFMDDQGVLSRLLDKYLAPQNSVLTETLARQIGENSLLFKKLSPTDSEGLVKVLEVQLRKVMDEGHSELVRALDPLAEDGAVARFIRTLREELKNADAKRAEGLETALAALDANDEHSLINRLMKETHQARQAVLHAVNPEAPDSPMAIMKDCLTSLLSEQLKTQAEVFRSQQERQEKFEREVRDVLVRLETRRSQDQKSPRGGIDFEDVVVEFVSSVVEGAPCVVEATGNTPGMRARCKKGDLVVRFTEESAFSGAGIVFEAKRDVSFTAQKALEELDAARANRDGCAGVFVMARMTAPDGFPRFARYGSNVLVVWDEEDPATDPYLHAAVLLGVGLATRTRKQGDQGDLEALSDIEGRIESELRRLDKMDKHNDAIRRNSEGIAEETQKARRQIDLLLRKARSTLKALNVELLEEKVERQSPITLGDAVATRLLSELSASADVASSGDLH